MTAPLRLPLETIERILFFALGGDASLATPSTCLDPITPPVGTAHLLLVSKGFTSLVLPLYWRSVTILRSDDWVKLWTPETGLFAGARGHERAGWVKEIRLNTATRAAMPVNVELVWATYNNGSPANEVLLPLAHVPLPGLRHVCFLAVGSEDEEYWELEDELKYEATEKERGNVIAGDFAIAAAGLDLETREEDEEKELRLDAQLLFGKARERAREQLDIAWEQCQHDEPLYTTRFRVLRNERKAAMAKVLGQVFEELASIRISVSSVGALNVLPSFRHHRSGRIDRRAASVYPSDRATKDTVRTFEWGFLSDRMQYDFVDFPAELRAQITAKSKYQGARWRWVEEDGTLSPFKPHGDDQ